MFLVHFIFLEKTAVLLVKGLEDLARIGLGVDDFFDVEEAVVLGRPAPVRLVDAVGAAKIRGKDPAELDDLVLQLVDGEEVLHAVGEARDLAAAGGEVEEAQHAVVVAVLEAGVVVLVVLVVFVRLAR